jgi:hypothetical protein
MINSVKKYMHHYYILLCVCRTERQSDAVRFADFFLCAFHQAPIPYDNIMLIRLYDVRLQAWIVPDSLQGSGTAMHHRRAEFVASLQRLVATYTAKTVAEQRQVERLENLVLICQSKSAEARKELALVSGAKDVSIQAKKGRTQLEDRITIMQQRLNATLTTNMGLHAEIDLRKQEV